MKRVQGTLKFDLDLWLSFIKDIARFMLVFLTFIDHFSMFLESIMLGHDMKVM
jgi:hypothetical protein